MQREEPRDTKVEGLGSRSMMGRNDDDTNAHTMLSGIDGELDSSGRCRRSLLDEAKTGNQFG